MLADDPGSPLAKTVTVTIDGHTTVEANETLRATLNNISAGATLFAFTGTGTISNDDRGPGTDYARPAADPWHLEAAGRPA